MTNQLQVNMETLAIMVEGQEVDKANSKSELFVALYDDHKCTIAEIKQLTGCHYSFIFGVINRRCEKRETTRVHGKADTIREYLSQGLTVSEISKKMETNYSYVYTVARKWRLTHEDYLDLVTERVEEASQEEEEVDKVPLTPFEQEALVEDKRTKKEIILDLHEQEVPVEQIAEVAQTTIKYVKNTIKAAQ